MSSVPTVPDVTPADEAILSRAEVAQILHVPETRVHQMLRQRQLLAVKRDGLIGVPVLFFDDDEINKHVPGVISVLSDGGYQPEEIIEYLYEVDDSLPGRPIDALHGHLAREVMRRAQAMAL